MRRRTGRQSRPSRQHDRDAQRLLEVDGAPDFVRVYFKYGTTTAYGTRVAARVEDGNCWVGYYPDFSACFNPGPANTVHKYSVPVAGLAPNTTYHFSLCANDEDPDRDICLNDKTFKTQS